MNDHHQNKETMAAPQTIAQPAEQLTVRQATHVPHATRVPHARPIQSQEVATCGALLGLCFEEEGWSAALVEVLDNPTSRRRFLCEISANDLEAFATRESVLVVDAWDAAEAATPKTVDPVFDELPAGTVLFDMTSLFTPTDYAAHWDRGMKRACGTLSAAEARLIQERARLLEGTEGDSWHAKAFPDGCGYISAVCVNPHYRGRGVLSALLDPLIARAERLRIPLCLETYAERSMNIYAHKGFETISVTTNKEPALTRYCMARMPMETNTA